MYFIDYSQSIFLCDEDSVSQYSIDGYHGDINDDSTEKPHSIFFERIGLKKKPQPHYATSVSDVLEEQPQLSDEEEDDDDEEEEESCSSISSEEDEPVPQISVSSPTTSLNSVLPSYNSHDSKYIKTKTKHKKYNQEFSRLILAQTIQTSDTDYQQRRMSFDSSMEPSPHHPYGAIWSIRFSKDGKYFASAGQSCVILLWKVLQNQQTEESIKVLDETPFMEYKGHKADILDLAWSKNNFLLSSSMDNTVRLWHTSQKDCLCVFQHLNFVTSIDFHPKDDRFFLSGSMDGRIRIWSIPEKRVAFWNEIPDTKYVTAVGFTLDGKTVIAGSHDGHCYFFETQSLKYNTQISVMNDTSSNRNSSSKKGPKITGIEVMPGLPPGDEKILITSNDSRVRLYNMKDKSLMFKYKGVENTCLQIKATFSDDGRYIISGSEDCHTFIWRTEQSSVSSPLHHLQETRTKAMSALGHVGESTLSGFHSFDSNHSSPQQQTRISKWLKRRGADDHHSSNKIRSRTEYFESHDHIVTTSIFAPTKTRQHIAKSKQDIIYNRTPLNSRRMSSASSAGSSNSFFSNPEEEVYADGHIIITADYRGIIKVWRIDSGSQSIPIEPQSEFIANSSASIKSIPSSPKVRRNFGGLFSSRK
ncbi:WD40-repeat-containing domain protein [Thamnidium elegans]|nr:WD40-repeat-containing domain protein [Thamnidium elegans]